jgi:hypothetical protein
MAKHDINMGFVCLDALASNLTEDEEINNKRKEQIDTSHAEWESAARETPHCMPTMLHGRVEVLVATC